MEKDGGMQRAVLFLEQKSLAEVKDENDAQMPRWRGGEHGRIAGLGGERCEWNGIRRRKENDGREDGGRLAYPLTVGTREREIDG